MLLLTGPTAAGKNTVARILARRMSRCAVVDFDLVRAMFVQPHRAPWQGDEGRAQQVLGIRHVAQLALGFHAAGWQTIILDVVVNETLPLYRESLEAVPLCVVQLLPSFEETRRRFYARGPVLTDAEFAHVYRDQDAFHLADLRLDTTHIDPETTATRVAPFLTPRR